MLPAGNKVCQWTNAGSDARLWQPYTDFLVEAVLMALPWAGSELAESAPDQVALLFSAVEAYVTGRPRRHQPGLQPFLKAQDEADAAAASDSGAASFLDVVLAPCMPGRHAEQLVLCTFAAQPGRGALCALKLSFSEVAA